MAVAQLRFQLAELTAPFAMHQFDTSGRCDVQPFRQDAGMGAQPGLA